MAFRLRDYDIEAWIRLDEEGLLKKTCIILDGNGRVIRRLKTRLGLYPVGQYAPTTGNKSLGSPALSTIYTYNVDGSITASVPFIEEWTAAHELLSADSIEGISQSFANVIATDTNGDLAIRTLSDAITATFTPSGLFKEGKVTQVTLGDSTWTAMPSSALADRNAISIQNGSATDIKINYSNAVSGYVGITIKAGFERYYDIKDSIIIYGKSESGPVQVMVEELA